jgi:hypothetical protein
MDGGLQRNKGSRDSCRGLGDEEQGKNMDAIGVKKGESMKKTKVGKILQERFEALEDVNKLKNQGAKHPDITVSAEERMANALEGIEKCQGAHLKASVLQAQAMSHMVDLLASVIRVDENDECTIATKGN